MAEKIAILGGGMSSLVTAYALTEMPDWSTGNRTITIYQQGWRLGGKGASGRNESDHARIEEHGLHLLFGCYENAFRILRACYTELNGGNTSAWKTRFVPLGAKVVMKEELAGGKWADWALTVATNSEEPGDGVDPATHPWLFVKNVIAWVTSVLLLPETNLPSVPQSVLDARDLAASMPPDPSVNDPRTYRKLASLCDDSMRDIRPFLGSVTATIRRAVLMADLAYAISRGLLAELVSKGLDDWFALDDRDFREWLTMHGASDDTVTSAPVHALYCAIFSGPPTKGSDHLCTAGAGTLLHVLFRAAFTFKGSAVYKMLGGMGDVVFAPLYNLLKKRGVQFKFFHRVEQIQLSADRTRVAKIVLDRQVDIKNGADYKPLVKISAADPECWPSVPLYDQITANPVTLAAHDLESGWDSWRGTTVTLEEGPTKDFDRVVLGISIGALEPICTDLMLDQKNPRFAAMTRGVRTTQTRALQVWFDTASSKLGSPVGGCVIPYAEPMDTICDMSHLLSNESWGAGGPLSLSYLCSPLDDDETPPPSSDTGYPARQKARVLAQAKAWLTDAAGEVWTKARDTAHPSGVDWSLLHDAIGTTGSARLNGQYVNAPVNRSDRYVLVSKGSHRFRLRAQETGYTNLFFTGDWTKNALSVGCLESATMGGLQTANAIDSRVPRAAGDWLPPIAPMAVASKRFAYLNREGDAIAKPPLDLDLDLDVFLLRADTAALTKLCDYLLNWNTAIHYRPVGPLVAFYCSRVQIEAPPFTVVPALDFGFWVPVIAQPATGPGSQRFLTFSPNLWVDNGAALIGGRSILGFPKQLAALSMPAAYNSPARFTVDTGVVPVAGAPAVMKRLIELVRTDQTNLGLPYQQLHDKWGNFASAVGNWIDKHLGGAAALTGSVITAMIGGKLGMPMVFLKQFPDETPEDYACYRAVIESSFDLVGSSLTGGQLPGKYALTINRYASVDLVTSLGLTATSSTPSSTLITPIGQAAMRFKARSQPGAVIATAT